MAHGALQVETLFDLGPARVETGIVAPLISPELPLSSVPLDDPETRRPLSQGERAMLAVGRMPVDQAAKADHLIHALDALALRNSDRGFVIASATPVLRRRMERWGGAHTRTIAAELGSRALSGNRLAQYEVFASEGLGRLALAGADTPLSAVERSARVAMTSHWAAFEQRYGGTGSDARDLRAVYKTQLEQQIAAYTRNNNGN